MESDEKENLKLERVSGLTSLWRAARLRNSRRSWRSFRNWSQRRGRKCDEELSELIASGLFITFGAV